MPVTPRVKPHLLTSTVMRPAPSASGVKFVPRKLYSDMYPMSAAQVHQTGFSCSITFFVDLYSPAIVKSCPGSDASLVLAVGISTIALPAAYPTRAEQQSANRTNSNVRTGTLNVFMSLLLVGSCRGFGEAPIGNRFNESATWGQALFCSSVRPVNCLMPRPARAI